MQIIYKEIHIMEKHNPTYIKPNKRLAGQVASQLQEKGGVWRAGWKEQGFQNWPKHVTNRSPGSKKGLLLLSLV